MPDSVIHRATGAPTSTPAPPAQAPARGGGPDLERAILRRGVGALAADRSLCADCGRTPLVGEHVYIFDGGELVCELCRPLRRQEPVGCERVRHSEHGHTVRLTARAA